MTDTPATVDLVFACVGHLLSTGMWVSVLQGLETAWGLCWHSETGQLTWVLGSAENPRKQAVFVWIRHFHE